uniref:26S proteasome complex subunit SEM1-like n=1 Tax=Styela clava TaxID=7725 RepID=UPI00193A6676|nr:26S proteasome complex subunit SEM1-like [Styela clava]
MADKDKKDEQKPVTELGSLEDDDEFEEFPAEEWTGKDKEPKVFWDENWDDDNIEDDFSSQLKAILEKSGQKAKS